MAGAPTATRLTITSDRDRHVVSLWNRNNYRQHSNTRPDVY